MACRSINRVVCEQRQTEPSSSSGTHRRSRRRERAILLQVLARAPTSIKMDRANCVELFEVWPFEWNCVLETPPTSKCGRWGNQKSSDGLATVANLSISHRPSHPPRFSMRFWGASAAEWHSFSLHFAGIRCSRPSSEKGKRDDEVWQAPCCTSVWLTLLPTAVDHRAGGCFHWETPPCPPTPAPDTTQPPAASF